MCNYRFNQFRFLCRYYSSQNSFSLLLHGFCAVLGTHCDDKIAVGSGMLCPLLLLFTFFTSEQCSRFSRVRSHCPNIPYSQFCQKLTIRRVLSLAFCIRIYRVGQRLSNFKLPCNLFGIIPVVGRTTGTK